MSTQKIEQFTTMASSTYGFSKGTIGMYKSALNQYLNWYNQPIELTTPVDVMNYLAYMKLEGKAGSTLTVATSALRAFFDYLLMNGTVTTNPTAGVKQRGRRKVRIPDYLTRNEISLLLAEPLSHIDPYKRDRDTTFMAFLLSTGLRISEALKVRPKDVAFVDKSLTVVGKGNKQSVVFITSLISKKFHKDLEKYIKKYNKHSVLPIFDLTKTASYRLLKKWANKAGIQKNVSAHTLRHTYGTLMHNEVGLGITALKEAMRHESIKTTQAYVHTTKADLKQALAKAGVV